MVFHPLFRVLGVEYQTLARYGAREDLLAVGAVDHIALDAVDAAVGHDITLRVIERRCVNDGVGRDVDAGEAEVVSGPELKVLQPWIRRVMLEEQRPWLAHC